METEKHTYKVRPGYGSRKLLIEFGPDSYDERFVSDFRAVLAENGLVAKGKKDLVFRFEESFDSPCGTFELTSDEWNLVFILADEHPDAIHYLDRILSESERFEKEEVNDEDYA